MRPIILVGGGGHCKSVIDVAETAGFEIFGILDLLENVGKTILGYEVIGTDDTISEYVGKCDFMVTVGQIKDSTLRSKIHDKIEAVNGSLAIIVSPFAHISKYAQIGGGTVVMHNAVVNADCKIGKGCIINTLANVEHDVVIGDFCHISTGAMINGGCNIGRKTFIGSQSVLAQNVEIVDESIISAGSFVRKSIEDKGIYGGNPAFLIG